MILHGKTNNNKQRFFCRFCNKSFVWQSKLNKISNEKHWFYLWVKEAFSLRQLSYISRHSPSKLKRIKNYWLKQTPPEYVFYSRCKHVLLDGTYFHKTGCIICLMDVSSRDVIATIYVNKENYKNVFPWLKTLKEKGLNPTHIVVDGERSVMRALKDTWPNIVIQRCLYHIQREGMRWLRTYPRTIAGKELRYLLGTLCTTRTVKERDQFINTFSLWIKTYRDFLKTLPSTNIVFKDLKRTKVLIKNALPDMFHFLNEPLLPSTTNLIEGLYSRLKSDYSRHRGLTEQNKRQYLKWYCFLNNKNIKTKHCG